jgi:hypothetical protein
VSEKKETRKKENDKTRLNKKKSQTLYYSVFDQNKLASLFYNQHTKYRSETKGFEK